MLSAILSFRRKKGPAFLLLLFLSPCISAGQKNRETFSQHMADSISFALNREIGKARQVSLTNSDSAIVLLRQAISESIRLACYNCIAEGLISIGAAYTDKGDYRNAERCYQQLLVYSSRTSAPIISSCRALNNLGNTYLYLGNYKKAMEYYLYAAQLAETKADRDTLAADHLIRIYNNTGSLLLQVGQYQKALHYFNQAEQMSDRIRIHARLPSIYVNKAMAYGRTGDRDRAWEYNMKAYAMANQIQFIQVRLNNQMQYTQTRFMALKGLAELLQAENKPAKAIPYLEKALRIRENINPYYTAMALQSLGSAYLSLKNYSTAEHYLLSALEMAESTKAPDCVLKVHQELAALYEQTQNLPRAFIHQRTYYGLKDSILNKEKTEAVNLLEVKFRTAEKEKEITQNQLLINSQKRKLERKNILITGISVSAIFMTTIVSLLYSRNRNKQRLQSEQIRTLRQQQEIDRLKALMEGEEKERVRIAQDLHDGIVVQFSAARMSLRALGNDHNNLASSDAFRKVVLQLDEATRDLRQTAHNLLPDILLEEGLAEAVFYFCRNLGQSTGLNIDFQLYGTVPRMAPEFELSLYRIIQELLHNIIRHAEATHSIVQLTSREHVLAITIEDNGVGIPAVVTNHGMGLKNIRMRVETLDGHLDVRSTPGRGTIVYIEFNTPDNI